MWGRNPKLQIANAHTGYDAWIQFIGDPHLGRVFKTGVPLGRLGHREEMQWDKFKELLNEPSDMTIIMGDLFDKFNVSGSTILRTATALSVAAAMDRGRKIVILKGNHDLSRDATKRSAFDLLTHIIREPNVLFVTQIETLEVCRQSYLFVPYDTFQTGEEYLSQWMDEQWDGKGFEAVFGHWDTEAIAGKTPHNMIPATQLLSLTDKVFTGHIHKPEVKDMGFKLYGTGSMQAYAHGEDTEDEDPMYVTLPLDQIDLNSDYLVNKHVRVLLKQGEVLPEINCLQLTKKYILASGELDNLDVELIEFDMSKLLQETMIEEGVTDEEVIGDVTSSYHTLREETVC